MPGIQNGASIITKWLWFSTTICVIFMIYKKVIHQGIRCTQNYTALYTHIHIYIYQIMYYVIYIMTHLPVWKNLKSYVIVMPSTVMYLFMTCVRLSVKRQILTSQYLDMYDALYDNKTITKLLHSCCEYHQYCRPALSIKPLRVLFTVGRGNHHGPHYLTSLNPSPDHHPPLFAQQFAYSTSKALICSFHVRWRRTALSPASNIL